MKLLKSLSLVMAVFFAVLNIQSCKDKDECDDVICQNEGTCEVGICNCPEGFYGDLCENAIIKNRLITETPFEIIQSGIPLDSLYGKMYKEGIIFYLNTDDGIGMVVASEDQSAEARWGCFDIDIMNLNNVPFDTTGIPLGSGSEIGDGRTNTDAILAGCITEGIAAKLCRDIGSDWFLPSMGELNLIYTNLYRKGHDGPFGESGTYWSSTEYDEDSAWRHNFNTNFQAPENKFSTRRVRAVRTF